MNNEITIIVGIIFLIINIILIIYIIKAGKYSELTYKLLKAEFKKQEDRDRKIDDPVKKNASRDIQDVWKEIQNE